MINPYDYWNDRPPEPSPRLGLWLDRIAAGWAPNKRIRKMGYDERAHWHRVYLWEYFHVLEPSMRGEVSRDNDAAEVLAWLRRFGLDAPIVDAVPCAHCRAPYRPAQEPDPCLGKIPGAWVACCGHGRSYTIPYVGITDQDDRVRVCVVLLERMQAVGLDTTGRIELFGGSAYVRLYACSLSSSPIG